jgi:two-component sensor histidine kinase
VIHAENGKVTFVKSQIIQMFRSIAFMFFFFLPYLISAQDEDVNAGKNKEENLFNDNLKTNRLKLKQARELYKMGKYSMAVKKLKELLSWSKKNNHLKMQSETLEGLGMVHNAIYKFNPAISNLEEALQIKTGLGDTKGQVRVMKLLSDVFYNTSAFDSAYYYASLSMDSAKKLNLLYDVEIARLSKIAALIRLRKWRESGYQLHQFEETGLENRFPNLFVQFHTLKGNFYLSNEMPGKGRKHYDSALFKATNMGSRSLITNIYSNMIDSYCFKGDLKGGLRAHSQYNEAIHNLYSDKMVFKGEHHQVFPVELYKNDIHILSMDKKLKDLQLLLSEDKNKFKDQQLIQKTEENKLQEQHVQRIEEKKMYLERESHTKDSMIKLKDLNILQKNKLLAAEDAKRNAEAREHKKERIMILGGLALTVLSGSIIFYLYRMQRSKNRLIEKQKDELQTLMKEIHHRVKNNLQVISSLLDLQSRAITNTQASEAIKEGRNRVLSMALIHQNLYGDNNIKRISIRSYIINLSNGLIDSYNIEKGRIAIDTDIDDLNLDVDTVIPIGLILNELVSNALKHAFEGRKNGNIHITLKESDELLHLHVKDNGIGFPGDPNQVFSSSFGMKLIRAFAVKLKAKMDLYNDDGACIAMHIRKYKKAG